MSIKCNYCGEKSPITDSDLKGALINQLKGIECTNENCESKKKETKRYVAILLPQGTTYAQFEKQRESNVSLTEVNLGPEDEENEEDYEDIEEGDIDIEDGEQTEESIHQVEL